MPFLSGVGSRLNHGPWRTLGDCESLALEGVGLVWVVVVVVWAVWAGGVGARLAKRRTHSPQRGGRAPNAINACEMLLGRCKL